MATKSAKRGLGKGLDSIIPAKIPTTKREDEEVSSSKAKPAEGQVQNLKITEVEPNKDQPRKTFNEDDLLELADSIKQHGIITPLLVTKRNGMYMIVAGERRWRAARKAGLKEVPAVVKNLTDEDIKAQFEHGVLNLTVAKKDYAKVPEKKVIMIEG